MAQEPIAEVVVGEDKGGDQLNKDWVERGTDLEICRKAIQEAGGKEGK